MPDYRRGEAEMAKTIMTVDDSASVRQMVSFTLKTAGLRGVGGRPTARRPWRGCEARFTLS